MTNTSPPEPSSPREARIAPDGDSSLLCRICGFHAPVEPCPHCGGAPLESSLRRRPVGPIAGCHTALWAIPRGLYELFTTPGVKRWLLPPFLVTLAIFLALCGWAKALFDRWLDQSLPNGVRFERYREDLVDLPGPLESLFTVIVSALEASLGAALALFTWSPLQWIGWFLVGSLILWFAFSLVYEMLAGPFLEEVHARVERKWFGEDPRQTIERPNDLPPERCVKLSSAAALSATVVFLSLWFLTDLPGWVAVVAAPLAVLPWVAIEPRFGAWLGWIARIETRAGWASLQAALITGTMILLALPLYFVPIWGYPTFAIVCGFATSVGLLDIPFERRGWTRRQRWRFIKRNLLPLTVFGVIAGLLLAIPVLGPILLVPSASVGGLWLVCRLDKGSLQM